MDEVIVVHFLCVDDVTVLFLAQILWVDAIGTEELLVSHTECLTNGLGYELGLGPKQKRNRIQQNKLYGIDQIIL